MNSRDSVENFMIFTRILVFKDNSLKTLHHIVKTTKKQQQPIFDFKETVLRKTTPGHSGALSEKVSHIHNRNGGNIS